MTECACTLTMVDGRPELRRCATHRTREETLHGLYRELSHAREQAGAADDSRKQWQQVARQVLARISEVENG